MKTMKDFLIYYNKKDVGPFLCALEKQIAIYQTLGVDLLKDGLSVPGITLKYMFKTIESKAIFSLFSEEEKDLHSLLRDNITGGASLIFHRYHEKDKTFIRNNASKSCRTICGYDANALYLSAIIRDMPTGFPTNRRAANQFKAERRH
ncbi:hypothetical protein PoB_001064200 [Plakobranchus ocellatus]|uniref:DNA-directed DNA polymerase n=1 Tax=Plakobranchus ocellatus TaxID=259542 RepID=A0AAV3YMI0_9GAST|nr:hypothetical protein PoB_001064200 [Plakobranchus ocellatus]